MKLFATNTIETVKHCQSTFFSAQRIVGQTRK